MSAPWQRAAAPRPEPVAQPAPDGETSPPAQPEHDAPVPVAAAPAPDAAAPAAAAAPDAAAPAPDAAAPAAAAAGAAAVAEEVPGELVVLAGSVADLDRLAELPVAEHVAAYDALHGRLSDALASIDGV